MQRVDDQDVSPVIIAVMGTTGTGKSTFIRLLTGDDKINIGHGPTSETSIIQSARYVDRRTGRDVVLIDTPGFDDSRGVTDTDILEQISLSLGPQTGQRPQLNGLIYMHRISDPRVGGTSLKNLRMFRALCGDENLANVRIVTTNWSRVGEQEGKEREVALANEIFKPLLDGKCKMLRHENNLDSAEEIISEFIPLPPITTQLELELKAGKKLNQTSAGAVLTEEITKLEEKHEEELADLHKDMEEAEKVNDRAWKEELEQERRELQQKVAKAENDRRRLENTLAQARAHLEARSQPFKRQPDARAHNTLKKKNDRSGSQPGPMESGVGLGRAGLGPGQETFPGEFRVEHGGWDGSVMWRPIQYIDTAPNYEEDHSKGWLPKCPNFISQDCVLM